MSLLGTVAARLPVADAAYRPALVIGMGGYASFPAALAAWMLRRPLLLQEQNAVPGSANRALARFARVIATGFPGVLANTRRPATWATRCARSCRRRPRAALAMGTVSVRCRCWYSAAASAPGPLNEACPALPAPLATLRWRHQCGSAHVERPGAA
jgi:UDP-N-acetylglucosamine--N-acetylmuramyl-(pentapeptide) pyrophosphoryl-undecaprenol N-acetylglucosamine transferase